ncbi:PAQR family membrane homeostasis protein TrhA [Pseudochrobactrum sp. HB0163]|uniref:PAQR family membrane homeostasis protein TrhA n=1 Tax=Pseudochrobactrum sp. HB0163 TaxID=3450708 RepID=UPI003F6DA546
MNQILQKAEASVARLYDKAELWADGIIHIIGVLLAISGAVVMLWYFAGQISPVIYISALIYVLSLVAALTVSAIYNIWPVSPIKQFLRRFDHSMIYVLIAGTYTPFIMKMGEGALGHLGFVWLIAACGIALKLLLPGRFDRLAILLYLALGWSGVLIYDQLLQFLSMPVVVLIAAGGIIYSLGVIFHVWERLRFQNAIWHGFVVTGAALHYSAVFLAVY